MQIQPTDIVKKNSQLWLSQNYLLCVFTDLNEKYMRVAARPRYKESISPCHRDKDVLPDSGKAWRWATLRLRSGQQSQFYYCYNNIPDKMPAYYKSQLPTAGELEQLMNEAQKQKTTSDLETFFKDYLNNHHQAYLEYYGDCTPQQQQNLSKACAAIEATIFLMKERNVDIKKNALFIEISNVLSALDIKYLPHHFRKFKPKVEEIITEGKAIIDVIKLPRSDNDNATKHDDEQIKSWVLQLRDMGQNYTNSYIIRKITHMSILQEKPVPCERWIGRIMEQHNTKFLTAAQRFGDKSRFANMYKGYIPLAGALFAGDCWQADATRVNIISHKNNDGKQAFIFIICIRDVHSGDILGYSFDYQENRWAYVNALAMAVKNCGYVPYELVIDKFPGHNTEEFQNLIVDLQNKGVKITITSKTTGKARLERHFSTMQTVFMQDSNYYYGEGIKSRRNYAHRSEAYLTRIRKEALKEGFDFEAATTEAEKIVNQYRNTELSSYSKKYKLIEKSPAKLHQDSEKPNVTNIDDKAFAYLFGLKKVLPVRNAGLLITTICKTDFNYRITDYNIISRYKDVLVCYNVEDLSYCHLYENTDAPLKKYLGIAKEEAPAQVYGPDAEWNIITKRQAIIAQIEDYRQQEVEHRKAVGDDIVNTMALLTPGSTSKDEYERAESVYVNSNMAVVTHSKNVTESYNDADENVRDQY